MLRGDGLKERIAWQLERLELAISRRLARGTGVLATIGSTAPFVGLFGTVWGIMNSFIGISNAHTTNLAVVAPGIAQALLATALGLIAAIPAVMIYNVLARQTAQYRALLRRRLGAGHAARQPRSRPRQAAARPGRRIGARRQPMAIRLDHGEDELTEVHDINVTAVHRRDAGAAHHLHGRGAARYRGCAGRSALLHRAAAAAAG